MSQDWSESESIHVDTDKHNLHVGQVDISGSLSSLSTKGNSLDDILRKCGDFGRFQLVHYFFMNWISIGFGIVSFYYVFGAAEPEHRCRLPESIWPNDTQYQPVNETHRMYINRYIPEASGTKKWEKCVYYDADRMNGTLGGCPDGWVFDRSVFGYTFTEEANFVCDNQSRRSWIAVAIQISGFSLLIIGSLADKYGRKKITSIITLVLFFTCLITQLIMQWAPIAIKTKFAILLLNQFASGLITSNYSLIFILMLELTSSARTGLAGLITFMSYTVGEVFVALFAYLTRHWQNLKWANLAFIGLSLPYLYFMPESPLYLYAKGQYLELEETLRCIATHNGRKESEWYSYYRDLIHQQPAKTAHTREVTVLQNTHRVFFHRSTILTLLITCLISLTTVMIYFQISYGLSVMNTSPYLAILVAAVVEAISYLTSSLLITTRLGRKGSFIILMSFTILFVLLIPITTKYSSLATIGTALLAKYSISAATAVSWIFVPELFPTSIRSTAIGCFIAFGRIGAILAPVISASISNEYSSYAFYASSLLALVVLLFSLCLPETKDKPMDYAADYSDNRSEI